MAFLVLTTTQHLVLFLFFLFSRWTLHKFCELYMPFPNIGNPDRDVNTSVLEKGKSLQKIRIRTRQCWNALHVWEFCLIKCYALWWSLLHVQKGIRFQMDHTHLSGELLLLRSISISTQDAFSCCVLPDYLVLLVTLQSQMRTTNSDKLIPALSKELI